MNNDKNNYTRKVLIVTTVASTLDQFCMNDISMLQKYYKVYVAANFSEGNNTSKERVKEFKVELQEKNIEVNEISFNRNPLSKYNLFAYKEIKKIINNNSFELIHCHTPVAAMVVRVAARKSRKNGTKVIYTAHGFHFYKGASLINWVLFYPVERWLARYTDLIVTINKEDYKRAKKSFKAKKVEYIPGVGIEIKKLSQITINRSEKRKKLGLPEKAFVILSVGELNKNKNHETIIKTVEKLRNPNVYYVICGQGTLENYLKDLIKKLGLEKKVKLLGYRRDIAEISKASDVFAFPSFREGLSVALMEAMALGLPIVCSNIRGNTDLIMDGKGGYLVKPNDINEFTVAISKLLGNSELRQKMCNHNLESAKKYDIQNIQCMVKNIY